MPIKGITSFYRPQRQGVIHLGIKGKKKKTVGKDDVEIEYPIETDYFVLADVPEVAAIYGDKPKELHVTLPSARFEKEFNEYLEKIFPQYLKRYRKSGLICRGDGEVALCVNTETGKMEEKPCPCEYLEKGECRRIGIFRFRIQEIPTLNVYQITTSSFNSIVNLNSFARDIAEFAMAEQIDIGSIKLVLKRSEQDVQRLEKGETKKSRHYIMVLDLDTRFYKNLDEIRPKSLPAPRKNPPALPAPEESKDPLEALPEAADQDEGNGPAEEKPKSDPKDESQNFIDALSDTLNKCTKAGIHLSTKALADVAEVIKKRDANTLSKMLDYYTNVLENRATKK